MTATTFRRRPLVLGVLVAAAVATAIADVVLNPGYITGTYSVAGVTVQQAVFQASAGSQSSSAAGASGSYQLVVNVPSGGSQAFSLTAYFYSDSNRDYMQLPTRTSTVVDGVPTTENYAIVPGFIQGTLTVNGGTTSSVYVTANAAQQPYSYAQTSLVAPYTNFHYPVYPGIYNVSGSATVNGMSHTLPSQQVTVSAGQTVTVNFVVNATASTGSISGNVAYSGFTPQRVDVAASGPVSPSAQLTQPGPYNFTALPNGNYSLYGYARYNGLQDYLYLPNSAFPSSNRSLTITAGGSATRDIGFVARAVSASVAVTGPRTLSHVNYGQVYATGLSPSAAAGGQAFARVSLPSGSFVLPMTDGTWRPTVYLQFVDNNQQTFLNATMEVYDSRPSNTIAVSGNMTAAPIVYEVGTVTVVMAVPPPLTFSSASLSGYCTERDSNNAILRQYYVNANRFVSNVSTASVTFVGLKGACDLQARVNMSGGSVSIGQVVTAVVPGVEQNVDIGGPGLEVTAPAANFVTTGTSVAVSGTATDDAQVQSVTVNNVAQTLTSTTNPADPREVAFSTTVNLPALGAHTITTRATDIAGKVTTDTRTVFRKAQPVITWTAPAAIPLGTALSGTQLNAVARVDGVAIPGQYAYSPAAGTILPVGDDQALSVTFTPTDQTRYLTAQGSTTIDVLASQPVITWPAPTSVVYGTPLGAAQLNAMASLGGSPVAGTFTYSPAAGTVPDAGTHELTVTFTPTDTNYQSTTASVSLTVTKAPLTVAAADATRPYGEENPEFAGSTTGLLAADGVVVSYTTTATASSPAGEYAIQPSLDDPAGRLGNYAVTLTPGTLRVTRRTLTVTANDVTRGYGSSTPAFSAHYSGFAAGDGPGSLAGTLSFGGAAATATAVGAYPIVPSGVSSANYDITFADGTLTITPAPLTVTANDQTRTYGASSSAFTVSYSGFVNGDDPGDLGGALTFGGTAAGAVNVGSYTIVPAGLSSTNYALTFVSGTLTVTQAGLTIRADDKTMIVGGTLPTFTATYTGFVNGDSPTSLDVPAVLTTSGTGQIVGSFPITSSAAADANYAITFVSGVLKVEYSSGACLGDAGHSILQPVNADGSSVFKQKSTVPLKFRVCDASGASVSSGVVSSFLLVQRIAGTATLTVNETPDSTTPDAIFRWDAPGQQWIFNLNTKNLQAGQTYRYQIGLADGSVIPFQFGLR